MFKIGDNVGVMLRDCNEYGTVYDVCMKSGAVSIAIGESRTVQVRACDVFYDEGYSKLKQAKYADNTPTGGGADEAYIKGVL